MKKYDMLRRAASDLNCIDFFLDNAVNDEVYMDLAAYHLQQSIEKIIKYLLSINGVEFEWTHNINILLNQLDEINYPYPDWVFTYAPLLTEYESKSRYDDDIIGTKRVIETLSKQAKDWHDEIQKQQQKQQQKDSKNPEYHCGHNPQ